MDLGSGDDCLHASRRLLHGRAGVAPDFLLWRVRLPLCTRGYGLQHFEVACACRRLGAVSHRRSPGDAGVNSGHAPLFYDETAIDRLLAHLHGDECRLSPRRAHL